MGFYGALIIYPKTTEVPEIHEGFTVLLQDWNHNDDPKTSYLRMSDGVFNLVRVSHVFCRRHKFQCISISFGSYKRQGAFLQNEVNQ